MQLDLIDRPFTPEDLDALLRIERQGGPESWTLDQMYWFLHRPRVRFQVFAPSQAPHDPIAFFVLAAGPSRALLANLAVDTAHRRRGVGSHALRRAEALAREVGVDTLMTDIKEENLPAQLLLRKHGYLARQILREHFPDQDGYRMVKRLQPLASAV
jgi:ribosomal protein S18 acetylase RimI-like enzyme